MLDIVDPPPTSLPDRRTAELFIKAYFVFANFHLPLLHQPSFDQKLDLVYGSMNNPHEDGQDTDIAIFFVNMVFTLGLLILQKREPSKFPTLLGDRYYRTAVNALQKSQIPEGIEGIQALVLMAQYAYLHPVNFGGWNMIGLALRRAVELDLHKESTDEDMDTLALDLRRRAFWVAYSLDRNIAITLGRPTFLSDGAITARLTTLYSTLARLTMNVFQRLV
ncbi:hypothetical protein ANO11243_039750 [Dothideomycetidae sp. 11243]|nr:hypothetical protein ANO11243_039750 [fungal sp. No.11243]